MVSRSEVERQRGSVVPYSAFAQRVRCCMEHSLAATRSVRPSAEGDFRFRFYQNEHLNHHRHQDVSHFTVFNTNANPDDAPSRETLAQILERGSLQNELVDLGGDGQDLVWVEVSSCTRTSVSGRR